MIDLHTGLWIINIFVLLAGAGVIYEARLIRFEIRAGRVVKNLVNLAKKQKGEIKMKLNVNPITNAFLKSICAADPAGEKVKVIFRDGAESEYIADPAFYELLTTDRDVLEIISEETGEVYYLKNEFKHKMEGRKYHA